MSLRTKPSQRCAIAEPGRIRIHWRGTQPDLTDAIVSPATTTGALTMGAL